MGSPPKDRKIIQVRFLRLSEAAILFFSLFFFCSFFFLDLDALDLAPIGNVALYLAITLSRSSTRCRTFKPTWDFIEWRCSALKLCKQLRPVFSLPLSVKRLLSCEPICESCEHEGWSAGVPGNWFPVPTLSNTTPRTYIPSVVPREEIDSHLPSIQVKRLFATGRRVDSRGAEIVRRLFDWRECL